MLQLGWGLKFRICLSGLGPWSVYLVPISALLLAVATESATLAPTSPSPSLGEGSQRSGWKSNKAGIY